MGTGKRFWYSVLFTRTEKQNDLLNVLTEAFPKERGRIFSPRMEYWVRKIKAIGVKPLFPGYIFIYTDMTRQELHEFIWANRLGIQTFVRELSLADAKAGGDNVFDGGKTEEKYEQVSDLSEEEVAFLHMMLDDEDVERMSVGYRDNDRIVVMEGPLKSHEDKILKVDRHNRLAKLDFGFRNVNVIAGLELKPKEAFFPKGKKSKSKNQGTYGAGDRSGGGSTQGTSPGGSPKGASSRGRRIEGLDASEGVEVLSDGTEVNLTGLSNKMMGS